MIIYILLATILGIFVARIIATHKCEVVVNREYVGLDDLGRITNVALSAIYICLAPLYMIVGLLSVPSYEEGILAVVGWVVAVIISSASFFSALGIGLSVHLRKRGKSKLSFAIQFLGLISIGISILLFAIFYGNLLMSIN